MDEKTQAEETVEKLILESLSTNSTVNTPWSSEKEEALIVLGEDSQEEANIETDRSDLVVWGTDDDGDEWQIRLTEMR